MFQGLLRPIQPYLLPPIFNPMTLPTSLVPRSIEAEDWERGGEGLIRKKENQPGSRGIGLGGLLWRFFMLLVGLPAAFPQNKTKHPNKQKTNNNNKMLVEIGMLARRWASHFSYWMSALQPTGYMESSRSTTQRELEEDRVMVECTCGLFLLQPFAVAKIQEFFMG